MATRVFTGWKTVTPGNCSCCGFDDGWDCDGSGTIFCECQVEAETEPCSHEDQYVSDRCTFVCKDCSEELGR
jgi:hypothetical protein